MASSKVMERIKSHDLYKLLEIDVDADEKAIKKAYRKKALKCHPDKNPDNPRAAEEFHLLSDAYEVLTDEETKKAYDNVLKARKANELRNRQLDSKRRKLKDELEARERAAAEVVEVARTDESKLAREIERLRSQGRKRLEEEQEAMRREIQEERRRQQAASNAGAGTTKLKVKWRRRGDDPVYGEDTLRTIFVKYGRVREVVVLPGKKDRMSGLVEMEDQNAAAAAATIEVGFNEAPLKVAVMGLDGKEAEVQAQPPPAQSCQPEAPPTFNPGGLVTNSDFESVVMMKLRQEELRKQEIQRIMEEDAKEEEEARTKKKV